jgi:putative ABC transport system ATP-binding protein
MVHLEVKELSKEYKRDNRPFLAVENVNLEVFDGDFIGIIGRSGSGKSTLLNLIAGLLLPTSGEILIDGDNAVSSSDEKASLVRNTLIGYIPQGQSLLANLTVFDNVRLPFYLSKREGNPDDTARELLHDLGIESLADCYPSSLSGGEMRRAAIARALINKPSILLADEPTSDLDEDNTDEIVSLFRRITKEGTAVIMVTHDLHTVKAADRSYSMDKGILLLQN